jgi:nucleotide-binding universal stress UspA family protein
MSVMRTILVPLDGSPLAERALPSAAAIARAAQARILLLRAANAPALVGVTTVREEMRVVREASVYLEDVASRLPSGGVIENAVFYGDAAEAILEEARLRGVDLVAMATHCRGGLDRLIAGSVAARVLREAGVPILLICSTEDTPPPPPFPTAPRILVALDGSTFAEAVLPCAREVAELLRGELVLMQSVPVPSAVQLDRDGRVVAYVDQQVESLQAEALAYLSGVADSIAADGALPRPRTEVRVGPAADTIAAASQELNAGLVAMATHGRTGLGRLLMGSVAEQVLRQCNLPVLLTRPTALHEQA